MNAIQWETATRAEQGQWSPRPTALVVIRCRISAARLFIGEKMFIQLGIPSIPRLTFRALQIAEILCTDAESPFKL